MRILLMYQFSEKRGQATPELAADFKQKSLEVVLRADEENYWGHLLEMGDLPIHWYLRDAEDLNIYMGVALIRDNKVHYYDRYPCGGGPYRITDFTNAEFRKRCEIIAHNIEKVLLE